MLAVSIAYLLAIPAIALADNDSTAPDTQIDSGPSGWINQNQADFIISGSDDVTPTANLKYQIQSDGTDPAGWTPASTVTSWSMVFLSEGSHTFYARAVDEAGNVDATPASQSFSVDTIGPSIKITTPPEGAIYTPNQSVNADYACSDTGADATPPTGSGVDSCVGDVADGDPIDTSTIGSHTFTVKAADVAGNTNTDSHNYSVIYNWTGFFAPADNYPTLNVVKQPAGTANQLLRFSLGSDEGLDIFANGYPTSTRVACPSDSPTDVVEEIATVELPNLKYTGNGQYTFSWKTDKMWKGTCRELNLKLKDGTDHKALFQFTK